MSAGLPPVGSKISLVSQSDVRYEGILYTIDTVANTVALAKVRSFGTEDRPTDRPMAPREEEYEYIIFRATDLKDIRDLEPTNPQATLQNKMSSVTKGKLLQLSMLQDPSYGIPCDITFHIRNGIVDKDTAIPVEVKGHKVILGAFSPVFKNMFFGPLKETREVVPIEQTTSEAFKILIDYMYQKDIDWSKMTVLEMYDIVDLAERYQMPDLMKEIKTQMKVVAITDDSLMDTAHIAAQFSQFPDISSTLLDTCARFLQKSKIKPADRLDFAINQSGRGQGDTILQLLRLVRDLPPLECGNCGEPKDECMDGKVVESIDKFTTGLKLRVNTRCSYYWGLNGRSFAGKVFTVISKPTTDKVRVRQEGVTRENEYYYQYSNAATFCYNCC